MTAAPAPYISSYTLRRRRRRRIFASLFILLIAIVGGDFLLTYHGPQPPIEIYHGIIYSCQRMPESPESGGLLHLVRADLNVPGVSIYITPLDPEALAHNQQYRLKYVSTVVRENHLAAAVNGTLFNSDSYFIRLPGDWATSGETVVSDHIVGHADSNTYLNWWDDNLIAHHELEKPPSAEILARAKWAIGSQNAWYNDFKISSWAGTKPDRETLVGYDSPKRLVWIAVFDRASDRFAFQTLASLGIPSGARVDGGTSSTLALGPESRGVRPGTATGNWRPVAVQFGFRADPIR